MSKNLSYVAIAVLGLSVALGGCDKPPAGEAPPIPVRVGHAVSADQATMARYTGSIRPRYQTDLGFRVAGKIAQRLVDVGAVVKPGQALAKLDPTDYRTTLRGALADQAAATADVAQTAADLSRYQALVRDGWAAPQKLEQVRSAADQARGRLDRSTEAVRQARDNLSYTELVADAAGIVMAIPTEAGQVVTAGQTVLTIARPEEREAVVAIPETQMASIEAMAATMSLWSDATGERRWPARLREIAPVADPATRTFQVKFTLPDADPAVRLGMTATIELRAPASAQGADLVSLPLSAVFQSGGAPAVWVVDNNRLQLTPIAVTAWRETTVLARGIAPGTPIVTAGAHKLDARAVVRVLEQRT